MIVSTPSYGGGSDLWDERRSAPLATRLRNVQTECGAAAMDDGKLEVVGVVCLVVLSMYIHQALRSHSAISSSYSRKLRKCVRARLLQTGVLHLANALGGISNGVRLCQGSQISIAVPDGGVPLQIDGKEPRGVYILDPTLAPPFLASLARFPRR